MKQRIVTVNQTTVIDLGRANDNLSTTVRFPVSSIMTKYGGGGTFGVLSHSPGDPAPHVANNVSLSGKYVEWDVGEEELQHDGRGEVQLVYRDDDGAMHSKIWTTIIKKTISKL